MTAVERRRQARRSRQAKTENRTTDRRTRCSCGTCTVCLDNARWEAIFNAKFADPDYYKARPIRSASSLNWVRPAGRSTPNRYADR